MNIKSRILAKTIRRAMRTFPAVVVTGPRQSGKTTLLKTLLGKTHRFVSLEDPDIRLRAREDPKGFLTHYRPPVIIDEIQYLPELLSYIKTQIDENRKPGQWLFTGFQHFVLMRGVSQSLAGRAAVLSLLPFSYPERLDAADRSKDIIHWLQTLRVQTKVRSSILLDEWILRGGYPELSLRRSVDRQLWCSSYIATYLERDVRGLSDISDLGQFEQFLKLCATRTGQILHLSDFARDLGVSVPTVKRWLSLLETGNQIFLLRPYFKNIGKRLIKSPKLYFNDTALASYLLGIHSKETLVSSPHFGNLFETMVVSEILKRFLNFGQLPSMYYLRTRDGLEVDCVIEADQKLHLFEIKSSMTITPAHAQTLTRLKREIGQEIQTAAIISATEENFVIGNGIMNYGWKNILAK